MKQQPLVERTKHGRSAPFGHPRTVWSGPRIAHLALAAIVNSACGGGGDSASVAFSFHVREAGAEESFVVETRDPSFIAAARAQLRLAESQRTQFPSGTLERGDGGANAPWSWHFGDDVQLVELSIELCDARPSMVEASIDYWVGTVKRFCPWAAFVFAELSQ